MSWFCLLNTFKLLPFSLWFKVSMVWCNSFLMFADRLRFPPSFLAICPTSGQTGKRAGMLSPQQRQEVQAMQAPPSRTGTPASSLLLNHHTSRTSCSFLLSQGTFHSPWEHTLLSPEGYTMWVVNSYLTAMRVASPFQHLKQILGRGSIPLTQSNHNIWSHITSLMSLPNVLHFIHFTTIHWILCYSYFTSSKIVSKFPSTCSPL